MAERRWSAPSVVLLVAVLLALLVAAGRPAAAATEPADCGGGDIVLLPASEDPRFVRAARLSGVDPACDGQPVGVQFLGNDTGDPAAPVRELAAAYSDEAPCTGADRPDRVLRDGAVEVDLCAGSATAGLVDGRQLTRLRLITTTGVVETPAPTAPPATPPGGSGDPDAAPAPVAAPTPADDLPVTGADVLRAVALGALLVLAGTGLVRFAGRRRATTR